MLLHKRTKFALAVSSALLLGGAMASPAMAASASPKVKVNDAVQTFGNMATGSCLDDSNYGLRGFGCNGLNFQQWSIHVWNDGTRQIKNVNTNRCLYDDGVTLATRPCNNSPQQSWWITHHRADSISFQSQATNKCLDDSQYGLRTIGCAGGSNDHQLWR
ncbi:RICIN domain-containing protein [Streptomyces sp. NPDC050610]|uniref:RICIN domain-containing protein n=1 Tax=Streptomyces sp. NPDC050610 TaxID=3157097 RepID=UPI003435ABC3